MLTLRSTVVIRTCHCHEPRLFFTITLVNGFPIITHGMSYHIINGGIIQRTVDA